MPDLPKAPQGLTRRTLLGASTAGLFTAGTGLASLARGQSSPPSNLVVVFANGGWDTTYCIDGKLGLDGIEGPEVDAGDDPGDVDEMATFGDIPVVINPVRRPGIETFFSTWASETTIVHGIFNGAIGHDLARGRTLAGDDRADAPDLTVMFGMDRGEDLPVVAFDLSYFQQAGEFSSGTGRLSSRAQLASLIDPIAYPVTAPEGQAPYPGWLPTDAQEADIAAFTERRVAALRERWGDGGGPNDRRLDAELESLLRVPALRDAGRRVLLNDPGTLDLRALLAIDMLKKGVTRSILLSYGDFDTHYGTREQNGLHHELFEGLDVLLGGLSAEGLLDDTLVLVVSEMTRSPLRNAFGGKDHWPHASAILFGGGLEGNRVVGATSDRQESLPIDVATGELWERGELLRYDQFLAGILTHLGVDSERWLPGVARWGGLA